MTMALATIASWAGSSIIDKFVSTGYAYLRNYMPSADDKKTLDNLHEILPKIKDARETAEALKMEHRHRPADLWAKQIAQALEASADVLDELEYKTLEDSVKQKSSAAVGSASSSKKWKLSPMISDDTLERLREAERMSILAAAEVDRIYEYAWKYDVHVPSILRHDEPSKFALTSPTKITFLGGDGDKKKIIEWLKERTQSKLSSFGIIGDGGLGKTTLAYLACQEIRGSNHFDEIIWVCVPTYFNNEDMTRMILKELDESTCDDKSLELDCLQKRLEQKIHLKKVLLVLDNVCNDENEKGWKELIAPFWRAQEGSKILFTTRKVAVSDLLARVIAKTDKPLELQALDDQRLKLIFDTYAFDGWESDQRRDFQETGDKIIKGLHGNPLAAKVIGSLVNSLMHHKYWKKILDNVSSFNWDKAQGVRDKAQGVRDVLKLSYNHLPVDLQACFRFCSIFPRDHSFDKSELIRMWIAAGFIKEQPNQGERLEDIGENYLHNLLRKSFFEYSKSTRKGELYVMQDLMYEMAQNVSEGECYRVEPNNKVLNAIPSSVRHISIDESEIESIHQLEKLRSLIITTSKKASGAEPMSFAFLTNFKSLRILKIYGYCECKLPEKLSYLVHLRYLSIELYEVTQSFKYLLPNSIYKLYHLQVLEFLGYGGTSSYSGIKTTRMSNLISLRYMRLPSEILKTIPRVSNLTSLQELTFFVRRESYHRVNELSTLKNLQRLCINNIENVGDSAEAQSAKLQEIQNLKSLSLKWTSGINPVKHEQIFNSLRPCKNLLELTISAYEGQSSPSWEPLKQLLSLRVRDCPLWRNQLFSWTMPVLKFLEIRNCPKLNELPEMPLSLIEFCIDNIGIRALPQYDIDSGSSDSLSKSSLTRVTIQRCPSLTSLNGLLGQPNIDFQAMEDIKIFDCKNLDPQPIDSFGKFLSLKRLSIKSCPNVTELPDLPLSLTELNIAEMTLNSLPRYETSVTPSGSATAKSITSPFSYVQGMFDPSKLASLREVRIEHCQNITQLNGFLQQDNIDFPYIGKIQVLNCINLVHLPRAAFKEYNSLRELTIRDCPKVMVTGNPCNRLPPALKILEIENCGELDLPLLESASCLVTLSKVQIRNCANIILGCNTDKFIEHSSREQALGANSSLNINPASFNINELKVGQLSLNSLRNLRFVSYLAVNNSMEALPEQRLLQNRCTLRKLMIQDAKSLFSLPTEMARLTALEDLQIYGARLLEDLPDLPPSLRSFTIHDAVSLKSLPATIVSLSALEKLEICGAHLLQELPQLPESLCSLTIKGSRNLKLSSATIVSLSSIRNLYVELSVCEKEIPGLKLPDSMIYEYLN